MSPKIAVLTHATKAAAVYDAVKRVIIDGRLQPGEPINQGQLAVDLGVSTTPVREAMRSLEKEGWVISIGHGDLAVRGIEPGETTEVYEVKALLEMQAVTLAAANRTEADIDNMRAALVRAHQEHPTPAESFRATREVHHTVYSASHHSVLIELLDSLWDRYERHQMVIKDLLVSSDVQGEHELIVKAVIAGDAEQASKLLSDHLSHASAKVRGQGTQTPVSSRLTPNGASGSRAQPNGGLSQHLDSAR